MELDSQDLLSRSAFTLSDGISKAAAQRLLQRSDILIPHQFDPVPPLCLRACVLASDHHVWSATYQVKQGFYRLIFLRRGSGRLLLAQKQYLLSEGSLFFFPLNESYRLDLDEPLWELRSLILSGPVAAYYHQLFQKCSESPVLAAPESLLPLLWREFHANLTKQMDSPLQLLEKLTSLLNTVIQTASLQSKDNHFLPAYLLSIREDFHINYTHPYTLAELEAKYQISKYRIVKEFHQAFGLSPIAYLNQHRLERAEELLLHSELRINEIASQVGFDNTNHFINLFRNRYLVTPGLFRRERSEKEQCP